MSKDNLFLGFARGSVGDVTFTRVNGVQVARARNRSPKNPKTPIQLVQRVSMKTAALGYSLLQDICNHAFQGRQEGTECQSRFTTLNVAALRATIQNLLDTGSPEEILNAIVGNFSEKSSSLAEFAPYVVSEGTLQTIPCSFFDGYFVVNLGETESEAPFGDVTYQDVVDMLGLQQGDQLTFLFCSIDDKNVLDPNISRFNGFRYARVILEPNDGDMTSNFLDAGEVNKPNVRNEGDVTFQFIKASGLPTGYMRAFNPAILSGAGQVNTVAAFTCIASRLSGGVWQRSSQQLILRPDEVGPSGGLNHDHHTDYLGEAIQTYLVNDSSSLYLNQAEV